jgi:hypothetical protein
MRARSSILALISLALLAPVSSQADPILDQEYDPGAISAAAGIFGPTPPNFSGIYQDVAQTFTVGLTGQLTSVEFLLSSIGTPPGDLILDIRGTTGGVPNENDASVLGSSVLTATVLGSPAAFVSFDLTASNIQVTTGQVLAIVLRSRDSTLGDDYRANGDEGGTYAGGAGYLRSQGTGVWDAWETGVGPIDFGFKTYTLIPEPGTALLLGLGMLAVAGLRRRAGA